MFESGGDLELEGQDSSLVMMPVATAPAAHSVSSRTLITLLPLTCLSLIVWRLFSVSHWLTQLSPSMTSSLCGCLLQGGSAASKDRYVLITRNICSGAADWPCHQEALLTGQHGLQLVRQMTTTSGDGGSGSAGGPEPWRPLYLRAQERTRLLEVRERERDIEWRVVLSNEQQVLTVCLFFVSLVFLDN